MDISILKQMLPIVLQGSIMTIELTIISVVLGSILGIGICLCKLSKNKLISKIGGLYTWIFRGTPMLLQLFVFYYGLPFIGIEMEPIEAAIIGLSLNSAAYMAEIVRGGILSVDNGQFEACEALGFKNSQAMAIVILPQAFKNIIPMVGNEFITMLKDTSLVSAIAMTELMRTSQLQIASTGRPVEALFITAILYLFMTTIFTVVFGKIENKLMVY